MNSLIFAGLILAALLLTDGCHGPDRPRQRLGSFFGGPGIMEYSDPAHLGNHSYTAGIEEKNGLVYTCRGGFIDIGHVREAADRTAYLADLFYKRIMAERTIFSFRLIEPSRYRVVLEYPPDWNSLSGPEKERIARRTAIQLAEYTAHTSLVWHEILTWFGFASTGVFSENISSFSWEDTYSDQLGVSLAGSVLRDDLPYDQGMTDRLYDALQYLGAQPPETARRAVKDIDGKWYTGGFYFFVQMKHRNFDVGLDDQMITPFLVPDICPEAEPNPIKVSVLTSPLETGFDAQLEIRPKEREKTAIYQILNLDPRQPIYPAMHFAVLLEEIKRQSSITHECKMGGLAVDVTDF